jgi:hypothetical protein
MGKGGLPRARLVAAGARAPRAIAAALTLTGLSMGLLWGAIPGCSRDFVATVPPPCPFTGITRADRNGNLLGVPDPEDWCATSVSDSTTGLWFAWPNPTADSVSIRFSLAESCEVSVGMEGPGCGILYFTVSDSLLPPGVHEYVWDCHYLHGARVPAGIYRCYMLTDSFGCHGDIDIRDARR